MFTTPPNPHPAPARFDVPEALQSLTSDLEVEGLGSNRSPQPPAFVEHFPALIGSSSCDSPGSPDYTDARYYLSLAVPPTSAAEDDKLTAQVDTIPGIGGCLTATNLAELSQNSHLLPPGTLVHCFGMPTRGGGKVYFFHHALVTSAIVQITAAAGGGGKYSGHLLTGVSTATSAGNLGMPEGLAAGASALILNEEEDGQTGHRLAIPSYAVGQLAGTTAGQVIVVIRGALGSTSAATTLSGFGITPDTTSWSRAANPNPINLVLQTRTFWDASAGVLYAYQRTVTFDARGALSAISGESQVTVDTATPCS